MGNFRRYSDTLHPRRLRIGVDGAASIRFRFATIDGFDNVREGWFVDDVTVTNDG